MQIFQGAVLQAMPDGSVTVLNLLDMNLSDPTGPRETDLLPYTEVDNRVLPPVDQSLVDAAPPQDAPDFGFQAIAFVTQHVPDEFEGIPVGFRQAYMGTVQYQDAYPEGEGNSDLLSGFNVEVWGLPTSPPARDPNNPGLIYQRFQRAIMQYDVTTGTIQRIPMGEYFKSLLTGQGLPIDLAEDAQNHPLFGLYATDEEAESY